MYFTSHCEQRHIRKWTNVTPDRVFVSFFVCVTSIVLDTQWKLWWLIHLNFFSHCFIFNQKHKESQVRELFSQLSCREIRWTQKTEWRDILFIFWYRLVVPNVFGATLKELIHSWGCKISKWQKSCLLSIWQKKSFLDKDGCIIGRCKP